MENTIAVVEDPLFLEHRSPVSGHPERPERLEAARRALSGARVGSIQQLAPRDASLDELARVHEPAYLEELSKIDGRTGYLDADTYFAPESYAAARRAAGGAIALTDALLDGKAAFGLGLVRPPGHHARPGCAMGFCLLNNVAVAAAHARARGVARVAIVDFDVHHGNGTQEIFYDDPSVLFISLHQFPFYPGTGDVAESGRGDGKGATVNVPLSAGAGDAAYVAAFERIVGPKLASFDPELVLISAGFDAHARDPLAEMRVTEQGYAGMIQQLRQAIPRGPGGRLGLVLEGGYDLDGLEGSLRAVLDALAAAPSSVALGSIDPRHEADLSRAREAANRYERLG